MITAIAITLAFHGVYGLIGLQKSKEKHAAADPKTPEFIFEIGGFCGAVACVWEIFAAAWLYFKMI